MTYDKVMKLAEEVFDKEYSGLDKDSFLIGFREAYNALTALYKDKFELVKRMREAQKEYEDAIDKAYSTHTFFGDNMPHEVHELMRKLTKSKKARQKEVDEYLMKIND